MNFYELSITVNSRYLTPGLKEICHRGKTQKGGWGIFAPGVTYQGFLSQILIELFIV